MPDFGQGTTVLYDAYFDTKLSDTFRVRAGKDKTPLGYEQLQSDYTVVFPERTLVTDLVPNRDVGIQARGVLAGGHLSYDGAVFNGVPDGSNGDIDTNGGKDLDGRLALKLGGLDLAIAGTGGRQTGEHASDRGVAPRRRFDPKQGTWGALQLAARYGSLTIDPKAFARGLAATGASRTATAAGVDATWFVSAYVKYVLSYERTVFDGNPD